MSAIRIDVAGTVVEIGVGVPPLVSYVELGRSHPSDGVLLIATDDDEIKLPYDVIMSSALDRSPRVSVSMEALATAIIDAIKLGATLAEAARGGRRL